ncbi:MAG: PQQ-binding-like beta-propeller repeat protein [Gammaproteobacteria bacterium]|nr:PQQ-binding-like beta-propeller repeat protein [Gammaproteobacteria bacterium]
MTNPRKAALASAITLALTTAITGNAQESAIPDGDWRMINRDLTATRFSPLDAIHTGNVGRLETSWTYELSGNSTAVPIVIDGIMYIPDGGRVVALDGDTGREIWVTRLAPEGAAEGRGRGGRGGGGPRASSRGVSYWPGDADNDPRIVFMTGARMWALNAATGERVADFGDNGTIEVGVSYNGTPTIYGNVAIIGAASLELPQGAPGNPRAFDVLTGEKLWEFWTVPQAGMPFNETWGDGWQGRGGTNMWGFAAAVDAERGIAYLPIAGPAPNYYGGGRPGANLFGNSIVAVDAETGDYQWHFQTVHHDLWDIDMAFAGGLFEVERNGQTVPAIANVGKSSYMFILNRENGEPIIPVEERPVPRGDVPTEWYSPTQPFPVAPPPLSRVSFNPDTDIVTAEDTSAAHRAACIQFMQDSGGFFNDGPFTPFLYKAPDAEPRSTIQFPGGTGGVNWGGPAVDPTTGIVYANSQETSLVGWVEDKDPDVTYSFEAAGSTQAFDRASINGKGPFFTFSAPLNGYDADGSPDGPSLPCQRPPWGRLNAVNASTGEILWQVPLGLREQLPEGRQLVGNSGSAGPSVTAGGLVFVGATNDRRFRAFDAATGEELWQARLEGTANANPMSYAGESGDQHIGVIAGNRIMVFGLP